MQKRIKAQYPNHPGALVPVITDSDNDADQFSPESELKARNRHAHAGETVRAYCLDNQLVLAAVVCAARSVSPSCLLSTPGTESPPVSHPAAPKRVAFTDADFDINVDSDDVKPVPSVITRPIKPVLKTQKTTLPSTTLTMTGERTMISLYRANIIEPLGMIRELRDLLSHSQNIGRGRSRVIFINELEMYQDDAMEGANSAGKAALRLMAGARGNMAQVLRKELAQLGIDVCEVVSGE